MGDQTNTQIQRMVQWLLSKSKINKHELYNPRLHRYESLPTRNERSEITRWEIKRHLQMVTKVDHQPNYKLKAAILDLERSRM
jgi:alpha-D-ribose 1-methylphosphonate 5-triphosphate diphosphatase PhnM